MEIKIITPSGKLFGILNVLTYILTIKDGKNKRRIDISPDGCTLWYTSGNGRTEEVTIPPKSDF